MKNPKELMYDIFTIVDDLERMIINFKIRERMVFRDIRPPKLDPPEFGLIRLVSWSYILFYEVGKVDIDYLIQQIKGFELDSDSRILKHKKIIENLRTYFQHFINLKNPKNNLKKTTCEDWFRSHCGTIEPIDNEHWKKCLFGLLEEINDSFLVFQICIRKIETDDTFAEIIKQWKFLHTREHSYNEFERLIHIVAQDMGLECFDAVKFRKQNYDNWTKILKNTTNYVFEEDGRKLIERTILAKPLLPLPITGKDLLEKFELEAGPQIRKIMEKAQRLYLEKPCNQEILLNKLGEQFKLRFKS